MVTFSDIVQLCPYPLINLCDIKEPVNGFQLHATDLCHKYFIKNSKCKDHYERLLNAPGLIGSPVQCPYGFTSFVVATNTQHLSITGIIPYPRIGGISERNLAKKYPYHKVTLKSLYEIVDTLKNIELKLEEIEQASVINHAMALHEIRKLNRTVKQTAERICREENPNYPDMATKNIVKIWKTAELMSQQFDIIEILANESLAELTLNATIEVYRIFDKCVRIYNSEDRNEKIILHSQNTQPVKIDACEKTFSIIPTVLLENALKYGKCDCTIDVNISLSKGECIVEVANYAEHNPLLNNSIFEKGKRASQTKEGSGHGLYLAQLVAKQHGSTISLDVKNILPNEDRVIFKVSFPIAS